MQLIHGGNPRCLTADVGKRAIFVTECDATRNDQKWKIDYVNKDAMEKWDSIGPA